MGELVAGAVGGLRRVDLPFFFLLLFFGLWSGLDILIDVCEDCLVSSCRSMLPPDFGLRYYLFGGVV